METQELISYIKRLEKEGRLYKFYQSKEFKKLRKQVIKNSHGECQECLKKHPRRLTKGTIVHHIKHVDKYPELALSIENLELVCSRCHWELHPEKHEKELKAQHRTLKKEVTKERW